MTTASTWEKGEGKDWIATQLKVGTQKWVIVSIHCTHVSVAANRKQLKALTSFIESEGTGKGLIIGGDFDTHVHTKCNNTRGKLLLEFCDRHGLVILKPTDLCQRRHTRREATIDYMLCSDKVF